MKKEIEFYKVNISFLVRKDDAECYMTKNSNKGFKQHLKNQVDNIEVPKEDITIDITE